MRISRPYGADGETAEEVHLDRDCGEAVMVDLTSDEADQDNKPDDLMAAAPEIGPGDIILVRIGWSDVAWGDFPRYYVGSPACTPEAALGWSCRSHDERPLDPVSPIWSGARWG